MKSLWVLMAGTLACHAAVAGQSTAPNKDATSLEGTWTLQAADVIHADGRKAQDYGASPKGLLMIDAQGRYSLQIFRADRPRFASGDRAKGTPQEYEAAVLGTSTHIGTVTVDPAAHTLTFHIDAGSFPNQDGTVQKRTYKLTGDVLSYKVAPRPNGDVPVSVWRRLPDQ